MNEITQNEIELYLELRDEVKRKSEKSFFEYFNYAWPTLENRWDLLSNWHIGLVGEHLEAVADGEIQTLIINEPTRYLKSQKCTIAFPTWVWARNDIDTRKRFIFSSYSDILSSSLSWKRRQLIESPWYQSIWSDRVKLVHDQNQKTQYANTQGGSMFSTSTGGTVTGEGCDIMVIDDPVKPEEASNDNLREKSINFWKSTLSSRFDNKKKKSCILVMQRLHERDLSAHFISEYANAVHLKIPNQAQEQIIYTYPKSGKIKIYEKDEILHPEREGAKELKAAKKELGSYNYSSQRQQEPVPRGGGMIKKHWFKYYQIAPTNLDLVTFSLDCAFKDLSSSDYVVLQAWGQKGANHYLLRQLRNKLSFLKTKEGLLLFIKLFPNYHEILIEDKANGTAIMNALEESVRSLIAINPLGSKVARLAACEPTIEAGNVWLPDPTFNPWVKDEFIPEVTSFPKAPHDDQVDAMSQYLNRAKMRNIGRMVEDEHEENDDEIFGNSSSATIVGGLDSVNTW